MSSGHTALETGCAPGGAVLAMLDRVVGVDPGAVDPRIVAHAHAHEISRDFLHIARPCGALTRADNQSRRRLAPV